MKLNYRGILVTYYYFGDDVVAYFTHSKYTKEFYYKIVEVFDKFHFYYHANDEQMFKVVVWDEFGVAKSFFEAPEIAQLVLKYPEPLQLLINRVGDLIDFFINLETKIGYEKFFIDCNELNIVKYEKELKYISREYLEEIKYLEELKKTNGNI